MPIVRIQRAAAVAVHPRRRGRMIKHATGAAKLVTVGMMASVLGQAIVLQHFPSEDEVNIGLREFLLSTALQLVVMALFV